MNGKQKRTLGQSNKQTGNDVFACLLKVPATCKCISGMDLLGHLDVLLEAARDVCRR